MTQDVVRAIERHANRYGVHGELFNDNGTQLKAMKHARFNVRDIDSQVSDSLQYTYPMLKSHEDRGKVERKIRTLREMLEK